MLAGDVGKRTHVANLHDHCFLRVGTKSETSFEQHVGPRLTSWFALSVLIVPPAKVVFQMSNFIRREQHNCSLGAGHCAINDFLDVRVRSIGLMHSLFPLHRVEAQCSQKCKHRLAQDQRQRGPKVYSLHAPEVECIGKGKAHRPYEFGVKVSVATTAHRSKGGQFVTHIAALPGNPYDGHTLATVIPAMEAMVGNTIERLLVDAGYRGHNAPTDYKFRVYTSGQKRRLTPQIKRELRRRAAIEPVIGHLKAEHRMGRNYLAHHAGDAVNAVLAAAGYNFHLLLKWLELLLSKFLAAQKAAAALQ